MAWVAASRSVRLPEGQRSRTRSASTLKPRAVTTSPTSTFAGAACKPSSASANTASRACTCTLLCSGAGVPPAAR
eukprot:3755-Pleurochrysis_carterae.AAC.1